MRDEPVNKEEFLAEYLAEIGIPKNMRGYYYLTQAILMQAAEPECPYPELIARIAAQTGVQPKQIMRSMQSAISFAWAEANMLTPIVSSERIETEKFIAIAAQRLRSDRCRSGTESAI